MAYKALFTQPYSAAEMQRVAELGIDATYIEESAFSEPGFSLPEQLLKTLVSTIWAST